MEDNIEVYLGHTVFNRHNERLMEGGRSIGYLHGEKWRPKENWEVKKDTHEPLISLETAEMIEEQKKKRLRATPARARQVYALSGVMKCALCGTGYAGDRGIYKCNTDKKPGQRCPNNDIKQETVEDAVFLFLAGHFFNFKNLKGFVDRLNQKMNTGEDRLGSLKASLDRINQQTARTVDLYSKGMVEEDDIAEKLRLLKDQKAQLKKRMEDLQKDALVSQASVEDIQGIIERFGEEVRNADPEIRKRVARTLFQDIRIHPKEGDPWVRDIELAGISLPFTRVRLASPRGFEPLSPA